jgi:HTH-type transcriptional regulator, sugar sensing transcriptional regulator
MRWSDVAILDEVGFSLYEKRALVTLAIHGVADAATLCRAGDIPTSKIYQAMEKLGGLGLVEVQRTRPKLYAALPPEVVVDRLVQLAEARTREFVDRAQELRGVLAALPGRLKGGQAFVDLALGTESHVKRHLARLADARCRILSYMEENDLRAIDRVAQQGFDVMRRIGRNAISRKLEHRVVFGFSDRTAPRLLEFLRAYAPSVRHLSGLRYSGEVGHPFHVLDDDSVVLSLDHPFVPEVRFASLLVHDKSLAASLAGGFETLWQKALTDLREIRFLPHRHGDGL